MPERSYSTPEAFRQALEQRIRRAAQAAGRDMGRLRQLLVFDRFLARLCSTLGDRVIVKGGLILELRLDRARTTKDVDLRMTGDPEMTLAALREAGQLDLGDFLSFVVEPDRHHPTIQGEGMVYDGQRFRAEARLAGNIYGNSFGIDVGYADVLTAEPEVIDGSSFFAFVGARPGKLRIYPRPTHIAEKLHAYTLPRERDNTRVKDLPDLALLAALGPIDAEVLRRALSATFEFRGTHPLPSAVPAPPEAWAPVYARMAAEDELRWRTIADVFAAVGAFLDPLLQSRRPGGGTRSTWTPSAWTWE
jgi:hypothetical protein